MPSKFCVPTSPNCALAACAVPGFSDRWREGAATAASDLDVLIEIDVAAKLTVFDYVAIKRDVAALFPGKVDVVNSGALKLPVGLSAKRDAIYAF